LSTEPQNGNSRYLTARPLYWPRYNIHHNFTTVTKKETEHNITYIRKTASQYVNKELENPPYFAIHHHRLVVHAKIGGKFLTELQPLHFLNIHKNISKHRNCNELNIITGQ
jgi:hypothetical protein